MRLHFERRVTEIFAGLGVDCERVGDVSRARAEVHVDTEVERRGRIVERAGEKRQCPGKVATVYRLPRPERAIELDECSGSVESVEPRRQTERERRAARLQLGHGAVEQGL